MDVFQMDFFIYILILMLLIGAFLVIYGSVTRKGAGAGPEDEGEGTGLLSLAQKLDTLESSVYEADEAVHMLGDMSKNVFKEFDSKYQELLFLYNLVDEKQKTLTLTDNAEIISDDILPEGVAAAPAPKQMTATVTKPAAKPQEVEEAATVLDIVVDDDSISQSHGINPKFAHVLELSQEGKSVEEIARELDMGKGEIMLILNLGGRRQNA
ncbi:MAG: hypothetical protein LBE55_06045 [Clostridiales bacterium]|jgi:hypothetical protein|nr:hypothetical protein [Clostridiales bacterium]